MKGKRVLALVLTALMAQSIVATSIVSTSAAETQQVSSAAETQAVGSSYSYNGYEYSVYNGKATITKYTGSATNLTIPSTLGGYSVTRIQEAAFANCTNLTTVIIPDEVIEIGVRAFFNCKNLTNINVSSKNQRYSSSNGILYNKNKTILCMYPIGKKGTSFSIPSGVKIIGYEAFEYCTRLINVTIPSSVTSIEDYAFRGCTNLKSITIPKSVTSIENEIFQGCNNITIYGYKNSKAYFYANNYGIKFISLDNTINLTNIKLNKTSITLGAGESYTLTKTVTPSSASTSYSWSSSNTSVATVNSSGKITAKASGTATITVKTSNGKKATCKVTVKKAPSSIALNKTKVTLGVGETFDLNSSLPSGTASYSVKYSSNNTSVASVKSAGGFVTAKKAGTATITATTYNGKKATCVVTVKKAPSRISLNKTKITLGVGETFDLNSSLPSGTASYSVKYSSNNTSVASVKSAGGFVTAKKAGTATITATTYNGKKATCVVTVKKAPSRISLNKTKITLGVGETFDLNSSLPSGTASYSVKYSSNNISVASVKSAGGLVTAKKAGTATITATTYNGKKAICVVTVKKAPSRISLNKTKITLGVGETFDLNSSLPSGTAAYSVKYSSNNTSVASVKSAGGLITAKKAGTATITAKTYNSKTVTCKVTVTDTVIWGTNIFENNGKLYKTSFSGNTISKISNINISPQKYDYICFATVYNGRIYYSCKEEGTSEYRSAIYSCNTDGSDVKLLFDNSTGLYNNGVYTYFLIYKGLLYTNQGNSYIKLNLNSKLNPDINIKSLFNNGWCNPIYYDGNKYYIKNNALYKNLNKKIVSFDEYSSPALWEIYNDKAYITRYNQKNHKGELLEVDLSTGNMTVLDSRIATGGGDSYFCW